MIDLHIHTTYSDGTNTVTEVLKKAQKMGLELISFTDHDKIDAHLELKTLDVPSFYFGKIITGCEFKTCYQSIPIEILGYGMDVDKIREAPFMQLSTASIQEKYLAFLKQVAKSIHLKFDENICIDNMHMYACLTLALELFKYPENRPIIEEYHLGNDANAFYRCGQSNPNSIFYIDESKDIPVPQEVINEIHKAGGLAFMAHPFLYPFENRLSTIEKFIQDCPSIDGLECYYSLFSEAQTKQLLDICQRYHLYTSGGSDYHGAPKPNISMGIGEGNLNIPIAVVEDWAYRFV